MTVVGIDPGLSGGIAWTDGEESGAIVMPILNGRPDLNVISGLLLDKRPRYVVIETPSVRPGESGTSALTTGINWGLIAGLLTERGVSWSEVRPQAWKKRLGIPAPDKGATQKQKKAPSIALALRLFPASDLKASERCRTYHDGMAEALLIAEFGRREMAGARA